MFGLQKRLTLMAMALIMAMAMAMAMTIRTGAGIGGLAGGGGTGEFSFSMAMVFMTIIFTTMADFTVVQEAVSMEVKEVDSTVVEVSMEEAADSTVAAAAAAGMGGDWNADCGLRNGTRGVPGGRRRGERENVRA